MQQEAGKNRTLFQPQRSGLLRRSKGLGETNPTNKKVADADVFCFEISDDSEDDKAASKTPQISIQLRQSTDVSPVNQDLLKKFNNEFMSRSMNSSNKTSKRRILNAPSEVQKKSRISEGENSLLRAKDTSLSKTESDQEEIIEIESVSSHDRNTRLKSRESSSEFQVSFSSKSTQPRPRLKNTRPVDSFEHYLANITRKYGPRTSRERVLIWEFTTDVSDVEDYVEFEERFEQYKTTKKYQTIKHNLIENNNSKPTCSKESPCNTKTASSSGNKKTSPPKEPSQAKQRPNAVKKQPSPKPAESRSEDDVVMSINTKTMEVYKNDTIILDNDESTKASGSLRLIWSDDESIFKKDCLNPEIDKITKLIEANLRKEEETADEVAMNCDIQEKFKVPNVPRKYSLPSKMDSSQKEEFYKYLGLGTRSPNGTCEEEHEPVDNKRRSLRVKRLQQQQQQSPTGKVEDKKNIKNSSAQDSSVSKVEMGSTLQPLEKNNGAEETIKPSITVPKPRRTCGPVIKTAAPPTSSKTTPTASVVPEGGLVVTRSDPKLDHSSANRSKKSESPGYSESEGSQNTLVLMRHTYEKANSPACQNQRAIPFCRDLTDVSEQPVNNVKLKNGLKTSLNDKTAKSSQSTLQVSKANSQADILYNKFQKMKESLKETTEVKTTSILLKCEYKNNKGEKIENSETSQKQSSYEPVEVFINFKSLTTCPVVSDNGVLDKSPRVRTTRTFRRATKKKDKRFQRVKFLRSSFLNQRILRNRKFILITTKSLGRVSKKSRLIKPPSRKRCNSEKSTNLLSPARIAKMDDDVTEGEEVVAVKSPEITETHEIPITEVSPDDRKTDALQEEQVLAVIEVPMPTLLPNPLKVEKGQVLHAYYIQDLLVVVQEFTISCWKYLKVVQMLGKSQEWELLGECKRNLNDYEIKAPYRNRMCLNDANPVYMEMRARQFPEDVARECNLASVYVNVYSFDEWKAAVVSYSVQLDTIRGLAVDVIYTTITSSRYFIMCWKQENPMSVSRTGLCKYALTPNLCTLASIREFKHMRHTINHLECISENRLIGFGESQVTIWDHMTGDVLTNFDLEITLGQNIGSILSSIQFESYLFLYQIRYTEATSKPQLKILAVTLSASIPSFRLVYTHELPASFTCPGSSLCTGDYVLAASAVGEEFLLLPHQPHRLYHFNPSLANSLKRFHCNGSREFVEISKDTLVVKTIDEYLMNFMK